MNFVWSTLRVNNLEESLQFYTDIIGLDVVSKFTGGHGDIAFLGNGATKIELLCDGVKRETNVGEDISWGFEVESLDRAIAMLKEKNITILSGPIQPNPNIKFIFIQDPNGMKIQLTEHIL